jgi:pimeloyl-ACP methyl ester carboxylesterase
LEHRYYGKSQPFSDLSVKNLRFLTTENALDDLADFERYAIKKYKLRGPWIAFGSSYSGSLAAYYRSKYPDLVKGALASSAPIMARANFEQLDFDVSSVVGPACLARIKSVVSELESSLDNTEQFDQYKPVFHASDIQDPADFLAVVADMAADAV